MMQRFKKLEYRRGGMKAIARSGHRTFDSQVDLVSRGNVYSNVQRSSYIRAHNETECNNRTWEPGVLQAADLKPFIKHLHIPKQVLQAVCKFAETEDVILYCFCHHRGDQRIVHGWVITSYTHELLHLDITGPTAKSERVIDWCLQYITPMQEPCLN